MARGGNKDLFLTIGADVAPLQSASKASRSALLSIGDAAGDMQASARKAFEEFGRNGLADPLREMERASNATFAKIRENAQRALAAPDGPSAVAVINAAGAEQAARAAEQQAEALRMVADTAGASARKTGEAGQATRLLAANFETNALQAEAEAKALRDQANAMNLLEAEIRGVSVESLEHLRTSAKVTTSAGQQRAAMQQLGFQLNDVGTQFSSGTPPMQIFAQQSGQVVQALQMMTNKTTGLLGFLGGPWGAVLTAATIVAAPLVVKLIEGNTALDDAVDKLKKDQDATDLDRRAKELYTHTVDGQIDAQRKLNDELDRSIRTQRQNQQFTLFQAQKSVSDQRESRPKLVEDIAGQQQVVAEYQRRVAAFAGDRNSFGATAASARLGLAATELARLRAQLIALDASIANGERAAREAQQPLLQSDVEASLDRKTAATLRYTKQLGLLNTQLAIGAGRKGFTNELQADGSFIRKPIAGISPTEYQRQLARISAARDAVKDAKALDDRQAGRTIDLAQARDIVASIGGRVTSGHRDTAEQAVLYARYQAGTGSLAAKPGTSLHEFDRAIDVAKGAGITLGKIVDAFAAQGVRVIEKLDEGNHYHIGWAAGPEGRGPKAPPDKPLDLTMLGHGDEHFVDPVGAIEDAKRFLDRQRKAFQDLFGEDDPLADGLKAYGDDQQRKWDALGYAAQKQRDLPTSRYQDRLQNAVGDMNVALDGVKADGLQNLEDGLSGVIDGTETVAGAFKKMATSIISDLTRIAVEKLILSAISGGTGGFFSFLGRAGGGKVEGRAGGGRISGPGTGTSDSILGMLGQKPIMLSNGESIVTADATRRYWPVIDAMNKGQFGRFAIGGALDASSIRYPDVPDVRTLARTPQQTVHQHFMLDAPGAILANDLYENMRAVGQRAVLGGARMAQHDIAEHQFQAIPQ